MVIYSPSITGSLSISSSGAFNNVGSANFTGSVFVTGSLNVNSGSLFVSSSGNVGIGNSSPLSLLQIGSTFSATTQSTLLLTTQASNYDSMGVVNTNEMFIQPYTYFHILKGYAYTSGSRKMNPLDDVMVATQKDIIFSPVSSSLFTTGSVGIGTTSPFAILTSTAPTAGAIGLGIIGRPSDDYGLITFRKNDGTTTVLEIGGSTSSGFIFNNYTTASTSFATNAVVRMTISASGQIGIGTSTPLSTTALDVAFGGVTLSLGADNNAYTRTNNTEKVTRIASANYVNANLPMTMMLADSYSGNHDLKIGGGTSALYASTAIYFLTAADTTTLTGTERMKIISNGQITINQAPTTYGTLSVRGYSDFTYSGINVYATGSSNNFLSLALFSTKAVIGADYGAGGGYVPVVIQTSNTDRLTVAVNGSIGAPSGTNIYNASDVRLKQNVTTITNGLSKINALNPVKFNWIHNFEPIENDKDMFGFIAQEVQSIIPEAVENFGGNSITVGDTVVDNPLRVNEKFIIPVLVKAIQELTARVQELENK